MRVILDFVTSQLHVSESAFLSMDKSIISSGNCYNCNVDDECLSIFNSLITSFSSVLEIVSR